MTPELQVQGHWWLPGSDHKAPGWLTWNIDGGGTMRLAGRLEPDRYEVNVRANGDTQTYLSPGSREPGRKYPVIHGMVDGVCYTLLNSFCTSVQRHPLNETPNEHLHVNALLRSTAWFGDDDDLTFDRATVHLRHLTAWIGHSGLSADHPAFDSSKDDRFLILTARRLPPFKADCDRWQVFLGQDLQQTGDHVHTLGIDQTWTLSLHRPDLTAMRDFVDTISDVQDLVSIAVGQTAEIDHFAFKHPEIPKRSLAGEPIGNWREPVEYFAQWSDRSAVEQSVVTHDMYFTFDALGGIDAIARWLEQAPRYRTELGRVMATRYNPRMYLEDRIMNVCAALDSFDRIRRGTGKAKVDYLDRLRKSIALAGEPFADLVAQDPNNWAKRVRDVRNDLAHHRDRFRNDGSAGEHRLAEELYWLFAFSMLRLAHAPDEVYSSVLRHRQIRWVQAQ